MREKKTKTQYVYFISYNFSSKQGSGFGSYLEFCLDYKIDNGNKLIEVAEQIKKNNEFKECVILNFILLRKEKFKENKNE